MAMGVFGSRIPGIAYMSLCIEQISSRWGRLFGHIWLSRRGCRYRPSDISPNPETQTLRGFTRRRDPETLGKGRAPELRHQIPQLVSTGCKHHRPSSSTAGGARLLGCTTKGLRTVGLHVVGGAIWDEEIGD